MDKVLVTMTVFFEAPFWVGVFEKEEDGRLTASKVTFGAEPRDFEVQQFILKNYFRLRFSAAVAADTKETRYNPKRMQREIRKQLQCGGVGTKSQQALKLWQKDIKTLRKSRRHVQKAEEKQLRFNLKQQKKKEKHRGR